MYRVYVRIRVYISDPNSYISMYVDLHLSNYSVDLYIVTLYIKARPSLLGDAPLARPRAEAGGAIYIYI